MKLGLKGTQARIAEAGWQTEVVGGRGIRAIRRGEKLTVTFDETGEFERARYFIDDTEDLDVFLPTVGAVLGIARSAPATLPFALDDDDATILAALAGRTITWQSNISRLPHTALVPRGGLNLKIEYTPAGRVISFVDGGFRSVRLANITKVT